MEAIIALLTLIAYALALFGLGLVVGFSPTLYVTLVAVITQSKRPVRQGLAMLAGVAAAVILLAALSKLVQPDVLYSVTHNMLLAISASTWLHYILGLVFIAIGWRYIIARDKPAKQEKKTSNAAESGLFVLGMMKTIASASGIAALVLGIHLISRFSGSVVVQLLLFSVMMASTVLPFVGLLLLYLRRPRSFSRIQNQFAKITSQNYRTYIGITLASIGSLMIILALIG